MKLKYRFIVRRQESLKNMNDWQRYPSWKNKWALIYLNKYKTTSPVIKIKQLPWVLSWKLRAHKVQV